MRHSLIVLIALLAGMFALSAPADAQSACTFTVGADPAPIYHAPLADPAQQTSILPAGASYHVVSKSGPQYDALFLIAFEDVFTGWVDPRGGTLNGPCDAVPIDDTPLIDYPTICTLTAASHAPFFDDAALSLSKGALDPGTYVVTRRTEGALFVRIDHAMGGYVSASAGTLSAACEDLLVEHPPLATAGPNARVWSAPNVRTGRILATLPEGSQVAILDGPVRGPIRVDTAAQGDWFQVQGSNQVVGWVWSERLVFDAPPPPSGDPLALALENARLWSAPNVRMGVIVAYLDTGVSLHVLAGPVSGPIRYDTDAQGDWYYVLPANGPFAGWIWAGRMASQ